MGTPHAAAIGSPPVCTSRAFLDWKDRLISFRLAECPVARPTTYYVDPNGGSDANSGLTAAAPVQTLGKAESLLAAGNAAVLLKRGTVFYQVRAYPLGIVSGGAVGTNTVTVDKAATLNYGEAGQAVTLTGGASETLTIASVTDSGPNTAYTFTSNIAAAGHTALVLSGLDGILVRAPHCTVGTYGRGAAPIISAFGTYGTPTQAGGQPYAAGLYYNSNSFLPNTDAGRNDAYSRTWSLPEARAVAVFRELNDAENPYRWLQGGSAAQVDANPGTWWQDTTAHILYVHFSDDSQARDANHGAAAGRNYEAAYVNSCNAITTANVDDVRIDGVRVDGYGAGSGHPVYGIKGDCEGTNAQVVSGCQSYYGGNHGIGVLGGGAGGIVTYYRCRAGLVTTSWGGAFVTYAGGGGNESLLVGCDSHIPCQPVGLQPVFGTPFFCHCSDLLLPTGYTAGNALTFPSFGVMGLSAGSVVTFTGGTSEAKNFTVTGCDQRTGVVTLDSPVAHADHTGWNYAAGPQAGRPVSYAPSLVLLDGCFVPEGPFQSSTPFGGTSAGLPYADLRDCRTFVVGDRMATRSPAFIDSQPQVAALTAASQVPTSAPSVTLAVPLSESLGPQQGTVITLSGGPSPAEFKVIKGVVASTGVVSFTEDIAGSGRSLIHFAINCGTGQTTPLPPAATSAYTCFINCRWDGAGLATPQYGDTGTYDVYVPGAGNVFLNCQVSMDYRSVGSPQSSQYRGLLAAGGSARPGASFYNCSFRVRAGCRDAPCFDAAAARGAGPSIVKVFNSLVALETAEGSQAITGEALVALGNVAASQSNNAYAGATALTGQAGYDNDPYYVELGTEAAGPGHPAPDSGLLSAHNQLVLGVYRLEYDAEGVARSLTSPAIGPLEPIRPAAAAAAKGSRPAPKGGH